MQEFDPERINPKGDKEIIHIHRFPAEVDLHYPVDVGIIGDISSSLDAVRESMAGHRYDGENSAPGAGLLTEEAQGTAQLHRLLQDAVRLHLSAREQCAWSQHAVELQPTLTYRSHLGVLDPGRLLRVPSRSRSR